MLFLGCCLVASAWSDSSRGAKAFANGCAGCHTLRYAQTPFKAFQHVSLPPEEAVVWFGQMPPDLSLEFTRRGRMWLTAYLHGFYPDPTRPYGTNNHVLPGVMMPDPGPIAVDDLVDFLETIADPHQATRYSLGRLVVLFLCLFWAVVYALHRLICYNDTNL
jgi:cytochrome c1